MDESITEQTPISVAIPHNSPNAHPSTQHSLLFLITLGRGKANREETLNKTSVIASKPQKTSHFRHRNVAHGLSSDLSNEDVVNDNNNENLFKVLVKQLRFIKYIKHGGAFQTEGHIPEFRSGHKRYEKQSKRYPARITHADDNQVANLNLEKIIWPLAVGQQIVDAREEDSVTLRISV
ncbi:hypothetical protein Tco_0040907 [Tanacetum coccineum]